MDGWSGKGQAQCVNAEIHHLLERRPSRGDTALPGPHVCIHRSKQATREHHIIARSNLAVRLSNRDHRRQQSDDAVEICQRNRPARIGRRGNELVQSSTDYRWNMSRPDAS
jgi:hypothetical protein